MNRRHLKTHVPRVSDTNGQLDGVDRAKAIEESLDDTAARVARSLKLALQGKGTQLKLAAAAAAIVCEGAAGAVKTHEGQKDEREA